MTGGFEMLDRLIEIAAPAELGLAGSLRLRRAWPRNQGHVLVEYEDDFGRRLAGQHIPDPQRLGHVADGTASRDPHLVVTRPELGLLLQAGGADRKLPALADLVARDGASLVVHRPERRAVVRLGDGRWAKVVRPGRAPDLVAAADALGGVHGVSTPRLLMMDAATGTTIWSHIGGRALIDLLREGNTQVEALRRVGAALHRVHTAPPPARLTAHEAGQEQRVLETWLERLQGVAPAWAARLRPALPAVVALLGAGDGPLVLSHGDLHDRQILVDGDTIGLIDPDTAALREPAQDLANLLVHLQLRGIQGLAGPDAIAAAAAALVDGYAPGSGVVARLPAFAAATRLRLSAVYRLRPRVPHVSAQLLAQLHDAVPGLGGSRPRWARLSSGA